MNFHVVGDSITYLAARHGATAMFAEHGHTATLDGLRGARADSPLRDQTWVQACGTVDHGATDTSIGVYALAANDLMGETFKDPDEPDFSSGEFAHLVSVLTARLVYGHYFFDHVVWVNVTTRTLNGHYNSGARRINSAMRTVCTALGFGYADWDAKKAPTSDLIHQKPEGSPMWVDAIIEAT